MHKTSIFVDNLPPYASVMHLKMNLQFLHEGYISFPNLNMFLFLYVTCRRNTWRGGKSTEALDRWQLTQHDTFTFWTRYLGWSRLLYLFNNNMYICFIFKIVIFILFGMNMSICDWKITVIWTFYICCPICFQWAIVFEFFFKPLWPNSDRVRSEILISDTLCDWKVGQKFGHEDFFDRNYPSGNRSETFCNKFFQSQIWSQKIPIDWQLVTNVDHNVWRVDHK